MQFMQMAMPNFRLQRVAKLASITKFFWWQKFSLILPLENVAAFMAPFMLNMLNTVHIMILIHDLKLMQ